MQPRIEIIAAKKLVGKHLTNSLANDKTATLWRSFMPERNKIKNTISSDLLSVSVYPPSLDFKDFTPGIEFEKWAAVEVTGYDDVPEGMDTYDIEGGQYAVFLYQGAANAFGDTFHYIFGTWLPASGYALDNSRGHFFLMGEKYKGNDPSSEEEYWIPVK